ALCACIVIESFCASCPPHVSFPLQRSYGGRPMVARYMLIVSTQSCAAASSGSPPELVDDELLDALDEELAPVVALPLDELDEELAPVVASAPPAPPPPVGSPGSVAPPALPAIACGEPCACSTSRSSAPVITLHPRAREAARQRPIVVRMTRTYRPIR